MKTVSVPEILTDEMFAAMWAVTHTTEPTSRNALALRETYQLQWAAALKAAPNDDNKRPAQTAPVTRI